MALCSIEEILEDYRNGKMVIITDDEDRENEGDLMMAADHVTAQDINFMARYGRGLICLTLTEDRCEQIGLPLMVGANNGARFSTNFTMSIEAAEGVTTGISAADRARTVQAAVSANAKPADIVMPGHIFPIMAQSGEFVMQRSAVQSIGLDNLSSMNETGQAGNVTVNIHGGIVQEDYLRNELIPAINRSGVRVA